MHNTTYPRAMARYNQWMNGKVYAIAAALTDEERKRDRGAYYRSIHSTLNHILWADRMWMSRFSAIERPKVKSGVDLHDEFDALVREREAFDAEVLAWADALTPEWLATMTTWTSGIDGKTRTLPNWLLTTHMFNHQIHHRGQVTTLLRQAGGNPDDTDIIWMPGLGELVGGIN